jgi:hypothetical protein
MSVLVANRRARCADCVDVETVGQHIVVAPNVLIDLGLVVFLLLSLSNKSTSSLADLPPLLTLGVKAASKIQFLKGKVMH